VGPPPEGSEAEAEPADRRAQEFLPACRAREEKVARKGRVTESDASGKAAAFGLAEAQGSLDSREELCRVALLPTNGC